MLISLIVVIISQCMYTHMYIHLYIHIYTYISHCTLKIYTTSICQYHLNKAGKKKKTEAQE